MERPPTGLDRAHRICDVAEDQRSLRQLLIREISRLVDFDSYAWLLTDPATGVGVDPQAEIPVLEDLPLLIRLRYLTSANRWRNSKRKVFQWWPSGEKRPDPGDEWSSLLRSYGVQDVATLVFGDRFGCWGFLDLWRRSGSFLPPELSRLTAFLAPTTSALRRCHAQTFRLGDAPIDRQGPVVLVLSPDLRVRAQTPDTDRLLRALIPPETGRAPIPAAAYNVAAQLLAAEAGVDTNPASARVHVDGGGWLTLRASRIGGPSPSRDQDIAVTIEPVTSADRLDLYVRANGLSAREAELLTQLSTGASTRQVADSMFLSENTVQDHLKSVFDKTGTRSRRVLLAQALGA